MDLRCLPYSLKFKHPFGVSGNTRHETPVVFVKLEADGYCGYGEACLPPYLGETTHGTLRFLDLAKTELNRWGFHEAPEDLLMRIDSLLPGHFAAKAAIDIAFHDILAKAAGQSYRDWKGVVKAEAMPTSFTIGIDTEKKIIQKIEEAHDYGVLKVKAGTEDDKQLITLIRRYTSKPLYIDVNQGWKSKEQALEMAEWLSDKNVVLLEQPLPKNMNEEMKWLTRRSPIATIADESVKRLTDLEQLGDAFSGVNIKLMKCTGLHEALKMIAYCKESNMKVLLGCMAESSCATSAMAQLMGYADYIDLDAPQLYLNDPFHGGVEYKKGVLHLNNRPGIGAEPGNELVF